MIYFVAHSAPALATGGSFFWLLYLFDISPSFFLLALPYLLAPAGAPNSSCIFPGLVQEAAISPWLEHGVTNQVLGAGLPVATGVVFISGPFLLTEQKNIYVRILSFGCTCVSNLYVVIYIYISFNMSAYWCLQIHHHLDLSRLSPCLSLNFTPTVRNLPPTTHHPLT